MWTFFLQNVCGNKEEHMILCNKITIFLSSFFFFSELKKLSEESLTRQPEEVFDIICKLGEG